MNESVRIDKWLWAVRLYKTRSLASEACAKGKISIADQQVKPSRMVKPGDLILIKMPPIVRTFKVLATSEKRMGAKLVPDFMLDVTSPEILKLLEMQDAMQWGERERGMGRPTKKDRREQDRFLDI